MKIEKERSYQPANRTTLIPGKIFEANLISLLSIYKLCIRERALVSRLINFAFDLMKNISALTIIYIK